MFILFIKKRERYFPNKQVLQLNRFISFRPVHYLYWTVEGRSYGRTRGINLNETSVWKTFRNFVVSFLRNTICVFTSAFNKNINNYLFPKGKRRLTKVYRHKPWSHYRNFIYPKQNHLNIR